MSISKAIAVFNELLSSTKNKREIKIYESFLKIPGMLFGILYGARKDAEAKKRGRVG